MKRQNVPGVSDLDRFRCCSPIQKLKTYWVLEEKSEGEETCWVRWSPVSGWIYTSLFPGATRFETEEEAIAVAIEQYPTERLYPRLVKPLKEQSAQATVPPEPVTESLPRVEKPSGSKPVGILPFPRRSSEGK